MLNAEPHAPIIDFDSRFSPKAVAILLLIISLSVGVYFFKPQLSQWGDNAQFIVLARSIVKGQGYREINSLRPQRHTKYPPGFPLLLTPFQTFAPSNWSAMKVFILLFYAFSNVLIFLLIRRWTKSAILALCVAIAHLFNPLVLHFSHAIMSEIPFLFFSLLFLLQLNRVEEKENVDTKTNIKSYLLLGLFLFVSLSIRSSGLALVVGASFALALKKKFKLAIFPIAVFITYEINKTIALKGGSLYVQQFVLKDWYHPELGYVTFSELASRAMENSVHYLFKVFPETLIPLANLPTSILGLISIVSMIGAFAFIKKRPLALIYFGAYLGILLFWPRYWAVPRMILPLIFLGYLFFFYGVVWLYQRSIPRLRFVKNRQKLSYGSAIILFIILIGSEFASAYQLHHRNDPRWKHYFSVLAWIKKQPKSDQTVLCRKPYLGYLLSKRKTAPIEPLTTKSAFFDYLNQQNVGFVILDGLGIPGSREYVVPYIKAKPHSFDRVFKSSKPKSIVFRYWK